LTPFQNHSRLFPTKIEGYIGERTKKQEDVKEERGRERGFSNKIKIELSEVNRYYFSMLFSKKLEIMPTLYGFSSLKNKGKTAPNGRKARKILR